MTTILAQFIRAALEVYETAEFMALLVIVSISTNWERLEDCRADL